MLVGHKIGLLMIRDESELLTPDWTLLTDVVTRIWRSSAKCL